MTPQGQPEEDQFLKIYLLTHLAEEERAAYLSKIHGGMKSKGADDSIKPQLVDWPPKQEDGSVEGGDLLRLYKQHEAAADPDGAAGFQYFADRESVDTDTVIHADRDDYTLIFSPETVREITRLAGEHGISISESGGEMDGIADALADDLLRRGVMWGRIPISGLWSSWCNLYVANMGANEIIELFGGSVGFLRDPEWDSGGFLEKMRGELRKTRQQAA